MPYANFRCFHIWLVGSFALKVQRTSDTAIAQITPIDTAVIQQSIAQLALSQGAMQLSAVSSKSAEVTRQEYLTVQARGDAEEQYDKIRGLVPQARAELIKIRQYAAEAAMHQNHLNQIVAHWHDIVPLAAEEAKTAVAGWIAESAAEVASNAAKQDHTANKIDKIANAVAAAAEPYHLAILRNQKFCAETYAKAKTAQASAQKLATDAKALALKGQELQASGMGVDAQESISVASGMMSQAEELRQWAIKLYGEANSACAGVAGYSVAETQAAANAAATTIVNEPMKLPPL